jgi:hypothetical protein
MLGCIRSRVTGLEQQLHSGILELHEGPQHFRGLLAWGRGVRAPSARSALARRRHLAETTGIPHAGVF